MQLGKLKLRKPTRIEWFGLGLSLGLGIASEYGHRIPSYFIWLIPCFFSSISTLVDKAAEARKAKAENPDSPPS